MAIALDTAAKRVKPLEGAIVRRFTAGAAVAAGQVVAMQSDGFVDPANTTAAAQQVAGIAIQAVAAGERADVVVFGPIVCLTGATPGATLHASNTAGEPAESAGTNAGIVGFVESATVAFVRPVSA